VIEKSIILSIPYAVLAEGTLTPVGDYHMEYSIQTPNSPPQPTTFTKQEIPQHFASYQITNDSSFIPERLEVRKQNNTCVNRDNRVLVMGQDKLHYKVLAFPASLPPRRRKDNEAGSDDDTSMSSG
jgi:hypothetical protein